MSLFSPENRLFPVCAPAGSGAPIPRVGKPGRNLTFGLKVAVTRAVGPIRDWLDDNMPDRHNLIIDSMSEDFAETKLHVMLASAEDREKFKVFIRDYLRGKI